MTDKVAMNVHEAVHLNQLSNGRTLGVVAMPGGSMYRIKYVDGKQGELPSRWAGRYTSIKYAQEALTDLVRESWAEAATRTKKA